MFTKKQHKILTSGLCDCFRIAKLNRNNEVVVDLYNRFVLMIEDAFKQKVDIVDVDSSAVVIRDKRKDEIHEELTVERKSNVRAPVPKVSLKAARMYQRKNNIKLEAEILDI